MSSKKKVRMNEKEKLQRVREHTNSEGQINRPIDRYVRRPFCSRCSRYNECVVCEATTPKKRIPYKVWGRRGSGRPSSFVFFLLASILWGDQGKEINADIIREKRKGVGQ